jgi:two-component system LytT family sensor kinase
MKFKVRVKFWHLLLGIICMGFIAFVLTSIFKGMEAATGAKPVVKPVTKIKSDHNYLRPLAYFLYILFFFYFAINYYYWLIADRKKVWGFLKISLFLIAAAFVYHAFLFFQLPQALYNTYPSVWELGAKMMQSIVPMLLMCLFVAFIVYLWESQKQRRILEAQKLQLENQISQANFNFLKAQINPHFLHNTLNFLYAKSLPYSPELSEGILTLSDIMRYALNQGYQKEGKAPLRDEIEHVRNVIKISQLRFSDQLNVKFDVTGNVEEQKIIPFVLITIVENAFKHGDLREEEKPLEIRLEVRGERLSFFCRNRKKKGPKEFSNGIGLENIKKRLFLAYGDKYRYIIKEDNEYYSTELIIDKL